MYRTLLLAGIALAAMILGGCSPDSDDAQPAATTVTSSSVTSSTSTTSTTTTTIVEPVDVGQLLVEILSNPAFSADATVEIEQITPVGVVTLKGEAAISGADSALGLTADFSELTQTAVEPTMGLIGPGFITESVSETRVVEDFTFSNDGPRWMVRLRDGSDDTTVGHIVSEMAKAAWLDTGTEMVGGQELHRLETSSPIDYNLTYFNLNPEIVTDLDSSTVVYATDEGFPALVNIDLVFQIEDAARGLWAVEYEFTETSPEQFVGPPPAAWVSIDDLSEGQFASEVGSPFDLAFPSRFEPVQVDLGYFAAQSELLGGIVADVQTVVFSEPPITFEQALASVIRDLGLTNPEIEESDFGGYPAAVVTAAYETGQPHYMYFSLFSNSSGLAVLIQLLGSGDDPVLERELFDEILSTFGWISGDGAVPGSSVGSALLQGDTEEIVLTIASVNRADGCDWSQVVYTEFLESTGEAWTEDWYVSSCDVLEIYTVTFTESPGGGTDIGVSSEPTPVEADAG